MSITLTKITDRQHRSAVEWIECWCERSVSHLSAQKIWKIMEREYSGGWAGFVIDLGNDDWS